MLRPRYFLKKAFPSHAYADLVGFTAVILEHEAPDSHDPLIRYGIENVILTPYVGSRTYESVVLRATMAVKTLIVMLRGERP